MPDQLIPDQLVSSAESRFDESTSLDRLYFLLRETHAEMELRAYERAVAEAALEAARKELEKAQHMETRIKGKADDLELAIIDRRRAERGISLASPPPTTPDPGGLHDG